VAVEPVRTLAMVPVLRADSTSLAAVVERGFVAVRDLAVVERDCSGALRAGFIPGEGLRTMVRFCALGSPLGLQDTNFNLRSGCKTGMEKWILPDRREFSSFVNKTIWKKVSMDRDAIRFYYLISVSLPCT
jgi:hypothetical protein